MKKINLSVCVLVGVWISSVAGSLATSQTPAGPGAEDIRGIRGSVEIPETATWDSWMLGAVAAAVALAVGIWWLVRMLACRDDVRILTARERSLAALDAARELMDGESSREYAFAVSDALRAFIEARFRLPSTRKTSEEFLRILTEQRGFGLGPYTATLADFMKFCDLGKFGKWQLDRPTMDGMHASALAVINAELNEPSAAAASAQKGQSSEEDFLDPVSPVPVQSW